jgi:hypothetical protein
MHTLSSMAKELNRPVVVLSGWQARFELPAGKGTCYSNAYLAFLRTVAYLRMLNISEESLLKLWQLEKKLLTLLHVDSIGSPTWFLDSCGLTKHKQRRLLLTNHDMGMDLRSQVLQLGLNFTQTTPELFDGREMGEDALRVLSQYLKLVSRIQEEVCAEVPLLRNAARWASRLKP